MKAVVLCGGKGARLRPYTDEIPKPMLPLGKKPILQYILENAKRNGIEEVFLTVGYKKEQIKEYFGDGQSFGIKINYVEEDEPKNTAGSILPLKDVLKETFLVLMGDHLTNINLRKMVEFHKENGAVATIAVVYPNIVHVQGYKVPVVFQKDEVKVLDKLKNIATREDYVVSWWD